MMYNVTKLTIFAFLAFFLYFIFLIYDTFLSVPYFISEPQNYIKICKGIQPPDPWDKSILKYHDFSEIEPLNCSKSRVQPELSYLENGFLYLNLTENIECLYRSYEKSKKDDDKLNYSEWYSISTIPIKIMDEFIEIECRKTTFPRSKIYSNNHFQILKKPENEKSEEIGESVLIIVLDSVSHSNFIRNMNKTLKVLTENYKTHIFNGMTKVGDNSFENAAAFFAGKNSSEFPTKHGFFDEYQMIWDIYKNQGFSTLYAEDYPQFNLFNYLAKGFKKKPVDHYFRPFWLNVYGSNIHRRSRYLCYGNQKMHQLQISYISQFISSSKNRKKLGIGWFTELGHDWLNQIRLGDQDFSHFFRENQKNLENYWIIVMADHGHRFDRIRKTKIGRIEERLPFFSISVPKQKRGSDVDRILGDNQNKLVSFWDVHKTLIDLSGFSSSKTEYSRGISLLTSIPDRSCQQSDIPEEFCVCQDEPELSINSPTILFLAEKIVEFINEKIDRTKCAEMSLSQILSATIVEEHRKYRIGIEVRPSNAQFEAVIDKNGKIFGDINRINKYGNQSICIKDNQFLRKLCFCLQFLV
ncbi:unnamed protein product [Caenorhabditis angaria]|uniref:Uncharacterized protein n=1 Tax=Caenorhabditis angaria TaxID=860376 RepID=A0A9P1IUH7_9PELO|nr:unnamed protein product [Caenorhabditis angaria]